MVDIIGGAHIIVKAHQVVDGGKNIFSRDVLGPEIRLVLFHIGDHGVLFGADFGNQLAQRLKGNLFLRAYAGLRQVVAQHGYRIHRFIGKDLQFSSVFENDPRFLHSGLFRLEGFGIVHSLAGVKHDLSGNHRNRRAAQGLPHKTVGNAHLFVELVPTYACKIVALGVEEHIVDEHDGTFHCGRFAGTELFINFLQGFLAGSMLGLHGQGVHTVLFKSGHDPGFLAEHGLHFGIGFHAQCPDQHRDRNLSGLVDPHIQHTVGIGLVFQPCAPVGNHRGRQQLVTALVHFGFVVHTGRTDDLRDDDSLGTVNDKGTVVGHDREIAHEDFLFDYFSGVFVVEPDGNPQGSGVVHIPLLALLFGELGLLVQTVIHQLNAQITRIVGDGRNIVQNLS